MEVRQQRPLVQAQRQLQHPCKRDDQQAADHHIDKSLVALIATPHRLVWRHACPREPEQAHQDDPLEEIQARQGIDKVVK